MIKIVELEEVKDLLSLASVLEPAVLKYEWDGKFVYYLVQYAGDQTVYLICSSDLNFSGFIGIDSQTMEIKANKIPKTDLLPIIKVKQDRDFEKALRRYFKKE